MSYEIDLYDLTIPTFVLNDIGGRGGINFRAHAKRVAMSSKNTFFVEPPKGSTDLGKAEIELMINKTILKGASIVKLSELPGFILLKEEPTTAKPKGPRAVIQRGSVEVAIIRVGHDGPSEYLSFPILGIIAGRTVSRSSQSYVRVMPADVDMLYVLKDGVAFSPDDRKLLIEHSEKLEIAIKAGLFDKYLKKDANGDVYIELMVRKTAGDVTDITAKGAKLVRLSDAYSAAVWDTVNGKTVYKQALQDACNKVLALEEAHNDSTPNKLKRYGAFLTALKQKIDPTSEFLTILGSARAADNLMGTETNPSKLAWMYMLAKKEYVGDTRKAKHVSISDALAIKYPLTPMVTAQLSNIYHYDTKIVNNKLTMIGEHFGMYVRSVDESNKVVTAAEADVG
jgi:hypothetical protein